MEPQDWNLDEGRACPLCRMTVIVAAFPALAKPATAALPESLQDIAEAACFFHPQNRAAIPCDECGRFLCHLCDLEMAGRHLCPECLSSGVSAKKVEALESSRVHHDAIALALVTLPALLFWPVLVTAPMAIFYSIRYWNKPQSLVPRTRIRFVIAIVLAMVEIGGIVALFLGIAWLQTSGKA